MTKGKLDIKLFEFNVCILITMSLLLTLWISLPKSIVKELKQGTFFKEDIYHTLRVHLDKLNFPLGSDIANQSDTVDLRTLRPVIWNGVSRYVIPWHGGHFILTNTSKYQKFVNGSISRNSSEESKTVFYNLLKDFYFYKPVLSLNQRKILMETIAVFARACAIANIEYFLCGDTLLGLYRHQGLVPWTGGAHVCMNEDDWWNIRLSLSRIPGFHLAVFRKKRWQFYSEKQSTNQTEQFPYIYISFYRADHSHIWSVDPSSMPNVLYKKQEILPFVHKDFDGLMLPVPCNMKQILMDYYGDVDRNCRSDNYKVLEYVSKMEHSFVNLPCEILHDIYPFVFREDLLKSRKEVLKIGEKVLSSRTENICMV